MNRHVPILALIAFASIGVVTTAVCECIKTVAEKQAEATSQARTLKELEMHVESLDSRLNSVEVWQYKQIDRNATPETFPEPNDPESCK